MPRSESYIGVMIEDLVSQKRDEPYRLFTARAENRLFIREDNSILRMRPYRATLELKQNIDQQQLSFLAEEQRLSKFLSSQPKLLKLLKRGDLDPVDTLSKELENISVKFLPAVVRTVAIANKYQGYIERFEQENQKIQKLGQKRINWQRIVASPNISNECRQRILEIRPQTFGQLQRINGVRPVTLAFVAGNLL